MKSWFIYFKKNRDTALLSGALLCLIIALLKPTVPIKHNIYTYLLIADISQSMNTVDMKVNGKPAARIAHTQQLMHCLLYTSRCV